MAAVFCAFAGLALWANQRLAPRCAPAGIEIALVGARGEIMDVKPAGDNERGTGGRSE